MGDLKDRLRHALNEARMRPAELARLIGVERATVSHWLSGKTAHMGAESVLRASQALGVGAVWLATGEKMRVAEQPADYAERAETDQERELLTLYRRLRQGDRARALRLLHALL